LAARRFGGVGAGKAVNMHRHLRFIVKRRKVLIGDWPLHGITSRKRMRQEIAFAKTKRRSSKEFTASSVVVVHSRHKGVVFTVVPAVVGVVPTIAYHCVGVPILRFLFERPTTLHDRNAQPRPGEGTGNSAAPHACPDDNAVVMRYHNTCSVRAIMSFCVSGERVLKNAEYPATRTTKSRWFSGCCCASINVSRSTTLY
jgi:hypothetical protein